MVKGGSIYTFGGYGEHLYKNSVLMWDPSEESFDSLSYSGEFLPRYMAGGAYDPAGDNYYIIGGYGSSSGMQTVNPDYYYEIIKYSFKDNSFTQVYQCNESVHDFCFAGSAVIDDSSNLYALKFSKYLFDNNLQLVKIPLENPGLEEVGNPIPYSFIDIKSQAELFFFPRLRRMLAVTVYYDEDDSSVDIYSIEYPPNSYEESEPVSDSTGKKVLLYLLDVILVSIVLIYLILRRRKKVIPPSYDKEGTPEEHPVEQAEAFHEQGEIKANSIIMFGGFQVMDANGKDITASFTPLLKKLLLFIMLNSIKKNKGVSSNILYETFWFEKSVESARNNRAVNIVKLKTLLENVGVSTITKDTGYWKFEYEKDSVYIDYLEYLKITENKEKLNRKELESLLKIINRGAFLKNTDADWLDEYKSEVSNEIIDKIAAFIHNTECEPEFILNLTNSMFMFDIASEEAMILQCKTLVALGKHSLSKKTYAKFIKEYKLLYDEDYSKSFNEVIEETKSDR
jgi:hypothetical protein